jgi:hypothetical protein
VFSYGHAESSSFLPDRGARTLGPQPPQFFFRRLSLRGDIWRRWIVLVSTRRDSGRGGHRGCQAERPTESLGPARLPIPPSSLILHPFDDRPAHSAHADQLRFTPREQGLLHRSDRLPALNDWRTLRFELPRLTAHWPACSRASAFRASVKSGLIRSACS